MKKGEDELLAISPPPEFQDSPSLPPPALFRDLSPSNTGSASRKNSLLSKAVQSCIREFADKVSYNILNEAMIIATLLPASGIRDMSSHPSTTTFPISSGVSFSTGKCAETSWELIKNSKLAAKLTFGCEETSILDKNSTSLITESASLRKCSSCPHYSASLPGMSCRAKRMDSSSVVVRQCSSGKRENLRPSKISNICDTTDSPAVDVDLCYSVPYEADVYSLPIDCVGRRDSETIASMQTKKATSKRTVSKANDENFNGSRLRRPEETSRRSSRKKEKRVFKASGTQETAQLSENILISNTRLSERNVNNELNVDKSSWGKKKRSRSVEVQHSSSTSNLHRKQLSDDSTSIHRRKEKRNFGHTLLNLFKRHRPKQIGAEATTHDIMKIDGDRDIDVVSRALPPPPLPECVRENVGVSRESPVEPRDFAASIEKVKDCGWYWGPLASDEAEDLLRGEPDGSFIVRDSSDAHYIFSLTFKLNGLVRHVRIEHDQGNFSFGPLTRFKAATIVEFVEKAVAHSRSGRYLFFLHRRPILGPMQVQLLHPYSRFRHPRSLQHMCRFVILKYVRRDLIHTLPLPKRLQDYLNTPHYYFEQQELSSKHS